jgi:hypothetical protein
MLGILGKQMTVPEKVLIECTEEVPPAPCDKEQAGKSTQNKNSMGKGLER